MADGVFQRPQGAVSISTRSSGVVYVEAVGPKRRRLLFDIVELTPTPVPNFQEKAVENNNFTDDRETSDFSLTRIQFSKWATEQKFVLSQHTMALGMDFDFRRCIDMWLLDSDPLSKPEDHMD
ncbi:hypothetical protein CRE_00524 [Caenorhabditis remanei]|uniref:Uncharacterized protein n=1 Tax=Caenorhabditis remanei TaxID=31234 RepID=E3LCU3_CAERE|nr:hypothetical protein CRE_00524 [Caenorhabditis remanei]